MHVGIANPRWRENVPSIPGSCATRNFAYLERGSCIVFYQFSRSILYPEPKASPQTKTKWPSYQNTISYSILKNAHWCTSSYETLFYVNFEINTCNSKQIHQVRSCKYWKMGPCQTLHLNEVRVCPIFTWWSRVTHPRSRLIIGPPYIRNGMVNICYLWGQYAIIYHSHRLHNVFAVYVKHGCVMQDMLYSTVVHVLYHG